MKIITTKTNPDEIVRMFRDENKEVNFETPFGWIYLVGGILNKLQDNKHYQAIKGNWVEV